MRVLKQREVLSIFHSAVVEASKALKVAALCASATGQRSCQSHAIRRCCTCLACGSGVKGSTSLLDKCFDHGFAQS